MKERLKEVRKSNPNGKTQESFANYLGISKENISSYESGRRTPSDSFVKLLCEKCNINEEWLRTGNGNMFIEMTKDEQISAAIGEIQNLGDENFKYRLVSALCKLSNSDWTALENLVDMISEKK